jgi:hypothetical protein
MIVRRRAGSGGYGGSFLRHSIFEILVGQEITAGTITPYMETGGSLRHIGVL